jgi:hypothetical protein
MFERLEETNDDEFIYDDNEAARVILQGITENLRKKLRLEDIIKILDYKYEYLEMEGYMTDSIPTQAELKELDQDALDEFVLANARLRKIHLTSDELLEIWVAEGDYFENLDEEPVYDIDEAAEVVYENISEELKEKLDIEDIAKILEVEIEYQEKTGIISDQESMVDIPMDVDFDAMDYYIIHECAKKEIILTYEELEDIMEGETIYLRKLGLVDDDGVQKHFN